MTARAAEPRRGVVGVVLAGGASRRMGRDKALIEVAGTSLAEHAARRLAEVVTEVVLADGGRRSVPGRRSIADGPGAGPAAGILAAAALRPGRDLLVLACDLPQVPAALLERLARPTAADARVPRWQRAVRRPAVEPLCALYRPRALARLEARVAAGGPASRSLALHRLLDDLEVRYLEAEELRPFGLPGELFLNLNHPQDLERFSAVET